MAADFDSTMQYNEHQQSVNNSWSSILGNQTVALWQLFIYQVMVTYPGKTVHDIFVTPS